MDYKKLNNIEINMDINNEKVGNNSVLLKPSNNQNMHVPNKNINTSTISMKEKLKNPYITSTEKKINDSEKNFISPSENLQGLDLNKKLSNLEDNTLNNGALNIDNYQQNTQKDFANENFNQNHENLTKNLEESNQRKYDLTNNSLYSFNSNDIDISNNMNEFPKEEISSKKSNLDLSLKENKKLSNNYDFNNNSAILNKHKNNISQISEEQKENNNKPNYDNNKENKIKKSLNNPNYNNKKSDLKGHENLNPNSKNEKILTENLNLKENNNYDGDIHLNENIDKSLQMDLDFKNNMNFYNDDITPQQTPMNVNLKNYLENYNEVTPLQTPMNVNLKNYPENYNEVTPLQTPMNVNLKSYMDKQNFTEYELDENDIVLLNEDNNHNKNLNNINSNKNFTLGKKEAKEGKLLLPKDNHNYLDNKSESIYEDAKSEKDNDKFTQDTKENNKSNQFELHNNINFNAYLNRNQGPAMGAYGNFVRNKSIDESSILTENEVSIHSNNKYFTLKKNNKFSEINNSHTNNRRNISENFNANLTNTYIDNTIDQSSYIVNKNPVGGAYFDNFQTKNNNFHIRDDLKSQISEISNLSRNKIGNFELKANENLNDDEKIRLNEIEVEDEAEAEERNLIENENAIKSNFFSPNTQTPIYITNKNNYDFNIQNLQNFNLNEEEISPIEKNNNNNNFNLSKNNNTLNNNYNFNTNNFITDMDEFNNNNFKNLLETEYSKIETNTKPQNNFTSNSESRRKEMDNNNNIENTNSYRRNVSNSIKDKINKSTISNFEDKKIKTIFDKIRDNKEEQKNLNYTATNINMNDLKKIINDNNNNNLKNKIIINQANITNSYNININNNNNSDFLIKEDLFKDLDTSPIIKNKNSNLEKEKEMDKEIKFKEFTTLDNFEKEIVCREAPDYDDKNLIILEKEGFNENQKNDIQKKNSDLYSEKESKAISEITYKIKEKELDNDFNTKLNNTQNSKKLEKIKKMEEPINDNFAKNFEDNILNEEKKEFFFLKKEESFNPNDHLNIDKDILSKIYGENFVNDWKNKAVTKISYHVKISENVKYFENNEINQKDFLTDLPEKLVDYKESLNEFLNEINKEIENYDIDIHNKKIRNLDLFKLDNSQIKNSDREKFINMLNTRKPFENKFEKISNLYNTEILEQKYTLNNEKILIDKEFINPFKSKANEGKQVNQKKISYWRESLCDGNSFYRMFMFSLMEKFIFKLDFMEMAKLFKKIEKDYREISKFNDNIKPENKLEIEKIFKYININNVLIIFNEILNSLINEDNKKAYKIMVNAFNLEDDSFDKVN
jgi:hypothetical protein